MNGFKPFVGRDYASGHLFSRKIMVLGDSHYCADEADAVPSLTNDIVRYYLDAKSENEGWMQTYRKFERSLVGRETTKEDSVRIWKSLMFYNFLQEPLSGPRKAGTAEQYRDSAGSFFDVIDEYRPDVIIVWGKRLWDNLPAERWTSAPAMEYDGVNIENGYYSLTGGGRVKTFCVIHPSAGYAWDWWYKVISKMM